MSRKRRGQGQGTLYQRHGSPIWTAQWYNAGGKRRTRSTRTTSRADAERIMGEWVRHAALERVGLVEPEGGTELSRHAGASLESHVAAFERAKRAAGVTDRHVDDTLRMIRRVADVAGWQALGEVDPAGVECFLERENALAPRTRHAHVTAVKTFSRWCVLDGRLAVDPLGRVRKPAARRQVERRALLVQEWRRLTEATEHGPVRRGMEGHERRLLYATALQTGLRQSELRTLTGSSLVLDGGQPHVLVTANRTKNRKPARQFIRPDLAHELRRHVSRAMPGAPVFTMPRREAVASMLRDDLAAAREARRTGLEPATTGSTVRYSNQLSYRPRRRRTPCGSPDRCPCGSGCSAGSGRSTRAARSPRPSG
jgi:hypothetical protein